jgi:hypothetical protein
MPHRLPVLAIALVIAVLPVTGVICEAICTEHVGHMVASAAAAHHHHTPDTPNSTAHHGVTARTSSSNQHAVVPVALRGCAQPQAIGTESRDVLRKLMTGRVTTTVDCLTILATLQRGSGARTEAPPHVPIRSISPLRI